MTIKIWQSYACNNSSAYRMVARFTDPALANDAAAELAELFPRHAAEVDERGAWVNQPSEISRALGAKYGFVWEDLMYWGDCGLRDDEPDVTVEGAVLVVTHTYCGGGLGEGLARYLERRGATQVDSERSADISVTVLFRAPRGADPVLEGELAEMFAQLEHDDFDPAAPFDEDSYSASPLRAPWQPAHEAHGTFTYFRDEGVVGLHFPSDPRDLVYLKGWLASRGIATPVIRIETPDDARTFAAIHQARCTACGGRLEYLDPLLHDIESRELACQPCGGLYDLATFVPPA